MHRTHPQARATGLPSATAMPAWRRWRPRLSLLVGALSLVACGGGNSVDEPASFKLLPDDLVGAPCASCREGHLVGQAHDGGPIADADVRVWDARGQSAQGRTDAQGRFALAVSGLSGPLLVQVTGHSSGEPVQWHALAVAIDVGNRALQVSPLTEMMSAFVLGGVPPVLLQQGRVDFMRVNATSLRSSQDRVRTLLQAALPAVVQDPTAASALELRVGDAGTGTQGAAGLAGLVSLQRAGLGYRLQTVGSAAPGNEGLLVDPVASSGEAPLPPQNLEQTALMKAGLAALPEIEQSLAQFNQTLDVSAGPEATALQAWLAPRFRHSGLDGTGFIREVLRPTATDSPRFQRPRLLQVDRPDRVKVRLQALPRDGSQAPVSETLWMVKSEGRWRWEGDGLTGRVQLRHLSILGPQAASAASLMALPGMQCPVRAGAATPQCAIEGGQGDVPAGGLLDFGSPQSEQFGLMAHYRSDAPLWSDRWQAARQGARLLATPSAQVSQHLAFEVHSRRIDPRVTQVRVTGPGLPETGLLLVAGTGPFEHLTLTDNPDQDWHAVRTDRCLGGQAGTPEASACAAQWAKVQAGQTYQFQFLDAKGQVLQAQSATLPPRPLPATELLAQKQQWFARFDLQNQADQQPRYARVLQAPASAPVPSDFRWAWQAPSGAHQSLQGARLTLHWGHPDTGAQGLLQVNVPGAHLRDASGPQALVPSAHLPALAPGALPVWLSAQLISQDAQGNRYLHYIAPNNPY